MLLDAAKSSYEWQRTSTASYTFSATTLGYD